MIIHEPWNIGKGLKLKDIIVLEIAQLFWVILEKAKTNRNSERKETSK
jgi:hypothetical protein